MKRILATSGTAIILTAVTWAGDGAAEPGGGPLFLPAAERDRLRALIGREAWAKANREKLLAAAEKGDGLSSAFLYALEGDPRHIPAARKWLLDSYGPQAWAVTHARKRLADPKFFEAGQPGIPEVYYDTDLTKMAAYGWVRPGLDPGDRKTIEEGIVTWARYKIRCMDRWTQTPNLVFKPTCTVAMAGLATGDPECLEWGFRRTRPWGGRLGGYDIVLETMLLDGGPWREAPIYPIAHEVLPLLGKMSRLRSLADGQEWWTHRTPEGSCPKGLMDYYLDTAYPIERTGHGAGQIRIATYGDGATHPKGDLFLVNPAGDGLDATVALAAAYQVSGDERYGAFLSLAPGYEPDLIERRPLPTEVRFPPAPSTVWPKYGLAMLRSDESPSYWTEPRSIAVLQIMSRGYGHDHRDKFAIALHGANRLIYPDYNAVQYENQAVGWTRCSPSHNTIVVDEGDTRDAPPTAIRHERTPEVKFLATCASGVFEGVDQTRALFLTGEYLLDLFAVASEVPHTYDYLLHGFGRAKFPDSIRLEPSTVLRGRYWLVDGQRSFRTGESWWMDFVIEDEPGRRGGKYGREWYDHRANLRLTMLGEAGTLVTHGTWGEKLASLVAERHGGAFLDRLTMVAVRRTGIRRTVFAAVHEPYPGEDRPRVAGLAAIARAADAVIVRIDGRGFTDYAAMAFGPQEGKPPHALRSPGGDAFAFRDHGYLRISPDGRAVARGGWTALRLAGVRGPLILDGSSVAGAGGEGLSFGTLPPEEAAPPPEPECPFAVKPAPAAIRLAERDRRPAAFVIENALAEPVRGRIELDLPAGIAVEPAALEFGPVEPGRSAELPVEFIAGGPAAGRVTVPFRTVYRAGAAGSETRAAARAMEIAIGPTLHPVYRQPRPYFQIDAPRYTARLDMLAGLCRHLVDDEGQVRLDGDPLFTISDGKTVLLDEGTVHAFTWPQEVPAALTAHAEDRFRWQALFAGDRISFRMDPGWTQFEKARFEVTGKWISPQGEPRWERVVAVDGAGKEGNARPGPAVRVAAAELSFPGARWSIAFEFRPPQEAAFVGLALRFAVGSLTGDSWSIGFCEPGKLDRWRGTD